MDSKVEKTEITNKIVRLAAAVSPNNMETVALGYLGLEEEPIVSLRDEHKYSDAFNRAVLRKWINMNSGHLKAKVGFVVLWAGFYRSCGKVMFLHMSVILSTGAGEGVVCPSAYWDTPPPRADNPNWADTSPPIGLTPPRQTASVADGTHPTGMYSCIFFQLRKG